MGEALTVTAIGLVLAGAVIPRLALDVAAVLALALLVIGGVLDPREALGGFGTPTLMVVGGMFILADALQRTGAVQGIGTLVERAAGGGQRWMLFCLLPVVMVLSGIMNNTGVVVLLLPLLITAAHELKISPSRLLLPLSYASITGGTLTLVGTTTTLLVDGIVRRTEMPGSTAAAPVYYPEIGFLEILPMGLVFCVIALLYLVFIGPKLLPNRTGLVTPMGPDTTRQYMTEILLSSSSRLVGRTLADFPRVTKKIRFLQLIRGEETRWPPFHDVPLEADDLFLVKGSPAEIVDLLQQPGLEGPPDPSGGGRVQGVDLALAEVMVGPHSRLDHQKVRDARMRDRFGVVILAVLRRGAHLRENLGSVRLQIGDILLVQGEPASIDRLARNERDLVLLGGTPTPPKKRSKAKLAIVTTAVALGLSAIGVIPLPMAVLLAAVVLTAGGCLTSTQAYRSIDLRILVILGCMLGVGLAAQKTGLAEDVARGLTAFGGQWGTVGILAMIYLVTALLTEMVTNAGTAAIMVPIAIKAAEDAGVSHRPFVFAVALAASCSFLTPIGYQTNLLVYGPGGYRLMDYLRLGTPLVLIFWGLATWLLPIVFPF